MMFMELENVKIIDELTHYVEKRCYSPDVLKQIDEDCYKNFPKKRTLSAILKTVEKIPIKISSSVPVVFMAREYLHRENADKRLIWMPVHTEDYGEGWKLERYIQFEIMDDNVKEQKHFSDRIFKTEKIECRVELSTPNMYSSASIDHDAGLEGFINEIYYYNQL